LLARRRPWIGERRYRFVAIAALLVPGLALLAVGAAELAWIWLIPAAAVALAPAWVGAIVALLPAALVLAPGQLREAAWNGFLPTSIPLAGWLAVLLAPAWAAAAAAFRRATPAARPLGSLVFVVGCGLAVTIGAIALVLGHPTCSSTEFQQFQLACEQLKTWP
jgi:hypothetical protein